MGATTREWVEGKPVFLGFVKDKNLHTKKYGRGRHVNIGLESAEKCHSFANEVNASY